MSTHLVYSEATLGYTKCSGGQGRGHFDACGFTLSRRSFNDFVGPTISATNREAESKLALSGPAESAHPLALKSPAESTCRTATPRKRSGGYQPKRARPLGQCFGTGTTDRQQSARSPQQSARSAPARAPRTQRWIGTLRSPACRARSGCGQAIAAPALP